MYVPSSFDIFMDEKQEDIWSNPINIIDRPAYHQFERSINEKTVSLPTLSKEEAKAVYKYEESLKK